MGSTCSLHLEIYYENITHPIQNGNGGIRESVFSRVSLIETPSCCMLNVELSCKYGQEFAVCRKSSIQVDHG